MIERLNKGLNRDLETFACRVRVRVRVRSLVHLFIRTLVDSLKNLSRGMQIISFIALKMHR